MSKKAEMQIRTELPELWPRMWRYALTLTKNREMAEDIAQAAAVRAIEKAHQFEPGTNLVAWLFTIISSIWYNQLRSNKVRTGAGLQPVEETDLVAENLDAETNIFVGEVLSLVSELPNAQRDAVVLVYMEGHSYKEAAAIMDVPIGTVMSRLASARKTLNQSIEGTDR